LTLGNTECSARTRAAAGSRNKIQTARLLAFIQQMPMIWSQMKALEISNLTEWKIGKGGNSGIFHRTAVSVYAG